MYKVHHRTSECIQVWDYDGFNSENVNEEVEI